MCIYIYRERERDTHTYSYTLYPLPLGALLRDCRAPAAPLRPVSVRI